MPNGYRTLYSCQILVSLSHGNAFCPHMLRELIYIFRFSSILALFVMEQILINGFIFFLKKNILLRLSKDCNYSSTHWHGSLFKYGIFFLSALSCWDLVPMNYDYMNACDRPSLNDNYLWGMQVNFLIWGIFSVVRNLRNLTMKLLLRTSLQN